MQALKDHVSPLDLPLEWDALESRMEKRKRRNIVYWLWPLVLGVSTLTGYVFLTDNHQKEAPTLLPANKQTAAMGQQNASLQEDNIRYKKEDLNVETTQTVSINNDQKTLNKRHTAAPAYKTKIQVASLQKHTVKTGNLDHKNIKKLQTGITGGELQAMDKKRVLPLMDLKEKGDLAPVNQTNEWDKIGITNIPLITTIPGEVKRSARLPNIYHLAIVSQNHPKPVILDLRMMVGRSLYSYKSIKNENIALVNQRKTYEHALEHISGRLSAGKVFNHQWYVTLGLSYTRLNEQWLSSRYDTTDLMLQNQVVESYTNYAGQLVEKTGNKLTKQVSEVTQTRYNSLEQIAATIAVGKYFYIHKMRWAIEANLSIPTYNRFSGQVFDVSGQMTDLKTVYQPYTALQYGMHTSYIYPVSGNLAIYGGYDYNFSRLKSDLGFLRTHHLHSLSLGMKYYIKQ